MTVELSFSGNIDADTPLVFTVGSEVIADYDGTALTAQVPVTAVVESLEASMEAPLTETTLHGSVITLTLTGRKFPDRSWNIERALSISGIDGVTVADVDRVSDTVATVELTSAGNMDTDATLTIEVGADAIIGYNKTLTAQVPVTAVAESLEASTEGPLTEATLHGSVVTLTLTGRRFPDSWYIGNALSVSGIDGVTVGNVRRVSDTVTTVELTFSGNMDKDATLTIEVGADAIIGYNKAFTFQFPVTAIETSNATVSISPASIVSPNIGELLTLSLNIKGGENVAGYQATVSFDDSAFYVYNTESANGDYLPADAFFVGPISDYDWENDIQHVTLAASAIAGAGNGDGTLATLTLKVVDFKASTVTLSKVYLIDTEGKLWDTHIENAEITIPPEPADAIPEDLNRDGVVNIQDLSIVAAHYGQNGRNSADVNGDGLVNIIDLVLVAGAFNEAGAAPPLNRHAWKLLTASDVQGWLTQARQLAFTNPAYLRGMTVLEQFLKVLTPKETVLLANYPNPSNPETWIPYQLAKDAEVTLDIYTVNGTLVRMLTLGHQPSGIYQSRSRAAYWDGKNAFGEPVASGVYFYTLTASDFTATRKMLIRK